MIILAWISFLMGNFFRNQFLWWDEKTINNCDFSNRFCWINRRLSDDNGDAKQWMPCRLSKPICLCCSKDEKEGQEGRFHKRDRLFHRNQRYYVILQIWMGDRVENFQGDGAFRFQTVIVICQRLALTSSFAYCLLLLQHNWKLLNQLKPLLLWARNLPKSLGLKLLTKAPGPSGRLYLGKFVVRYRQSL